jgi:hypothetical protein
MAELVAKLSGRLEQKPAQEKAAEGKPKGAPAPNRDRLTVGVDLGDQWSNYCILGLEGETLAEGQWRTTREDVAAFFQALAAARVIIEVGTHSAWVREAEQGSRITGNTGKSVDGERDSAGSVVAVKRVTTVERRDPAVCSGSNNMGGKVE